MDTKKQDISPPAFPLKLLKWLCKPEYHPDIEGDLLELYHRRVTKIGKRKARILLFKDVILLLRPGMIRSLEHKNINSYGMYKSYFKIGWRNLLRNKGYASINIGGLGVGMAGAILIGLWVYDESSFNKSFENYDHIAQVMIHNGVGTYKNHPIPLADELRSSYPEDFQHVVMSTQTQEYIISSEDKKFMQMGNYMEQGAPELLSLSMVAGTWQDLKNTHSIFLSESLSNKLFGTTDPTGKIVRINNELTVTVTGVNNTAEAPALIVILNHQMNV